MRLRLRKIVAERTRMTGESGIAEVVRILMTVRGGMKRKPGENERGLLSAEAAMGGGGR